MSRHEAGFQVGAACPGQAMHAERVAHRPRDFTRTLKYCINGNPERAERDARSILGGLSTDNLSMACGSYVTQSLNGILGI